MQNTQPRQLTLISHKLCPYVQRAVIALEEQGIDYKRIDIDLGNPPEWFKRLSPLGKVPVLLVDDDNVIFESAVIAEYINDIGNGELLASNPIDKARQRAWIEFASATLDNIGTLYSASGEKSFARAVSQLESKWSQLEANLGELVFFSGDKFSLVDAAFAPMFRYLDLFEQLAELEFLSAYPGVAGWRQSLRERESVQRAVRPNYQNLLAEFIAARDSYLGQKARQYLAQRNAA
jgi:glutathione S-transferase